MKDNPSFKDFMEGKLKLGSTSEQNGKKIKRTNGMKRSSKPFYTNARNNETNGNPNSWQTYISKNSFSQESFFPKSKHTVFLLQRLVTE